MQPLEIEVKFFIESIDAIQRAILSLGAVPAPRVFETNLRFEDPDGSLLRRKCLLRLRRDPKVTLTFKAPPPVADTAFKVYREFEVEVSDFGTTVRILEALGFRPVQVYEKWRQTLTLGATHLCLDTLPFGSFLEIEGTREAIRRLSGRLGLPWERRILHNYLAIFSRLQTELGLPFQDVTFDNFKALSFDMAAHVRRFESGSASPA